MARTMLLAHEVETELNRMRMENDIDEKFERKFVADKVTDARNNGRTGDVVIMAIDPLLLHIPSWQRPCEIARAKAIGETYNVDSWDEPKVLYWNGKLWLIDGMHRGFGTAMVGKSQIAVRLMSENATMKTAIDVFLHQTDLIKKMSLTDKLDAALKAEVPEYVILKGVCDRNRVCVNGMDFDEDEHVGTFTSIRDGLKMAKSNPELLDRILCMTTRLHWNGDKFTVGKAYGARAFRALRKLYSYFGGNREELERILITYCSGASFWNENLETKTQAQMFDLLSNIIYRHINVTNITDEINTQNITKIGA